jgi:cytochrome b6-f complex iron-sulfur subunit
MALGFDRRRFLRASCALLAAGCGRPEDDRASDSSDTDPAETALEETGGDTVPVELYPCGQEVSAGAAGWAELPLAQWPDLGVVGGWYPVDLAGVALVVAQVEEGCYAAIARACAHEGAPIEYHPDRGQFVCPRHGAIYAADGEAVAGPQPSGLPVYPCGRVGESVWVKPG